jgi:hypothetical protein
MSKNHQDPMKDNESIAASIIARRLIASNVNANEGRSGLPLTETSEARAEPTDAAKDEEIEQRNAREEQTEINQIESTAESATPMLPTAAKPESIALCSRMVNSLREILTINERAEDSLDHFVSKRSEFVATKAKMSMHDSYQLRALLSRLQVDHQTGGLELATTWKTLKDVMRGIQGDESLDGEFAELMFLGCSELIDDMANMGIWKKIKMRHVALLGSSSTLQSTIAQFILQANYFLSHVMMLRQPEDLLRFYFVLRQDLAILAQEQEVLVKDFGVDVTSMAASTEKLSAVKYWSFPWRLTMDITFGPGPPEKVVTKTALLYNLTATLVHCRPCSLADQPWVCSPVSQLGVTIQSCECRHLPTIRPSFRWTIQLLLHQ